MKHKILHFVFLLSLGILLMAGPMMAQTEHQRAKTAEKYYLSKKYDQATPLYAQLVSSNPKNYKFNYYYGICLMITSGDKTQAIPYMETAMLNPKTPEDIYYYMGRALHLNYRFEEAMRSFVEFNSIIGSKNISKWSTPELMEYCNNAKSILDTTKNSIIQEKIESMPGDFYSHYDFTAGNGKLLSMPEGMVKTSKSENDEQPMIFLSANGRVMYYSAANAESNSRDIYRVEKGLDNNWGDPVCLDMNVNTKQDELFPSCNPDGRILYFSSRGHNSTGGFDIFKSYYNSVTKTWSTPVNMGSPYNSPDDDFCFVASTEEKIAYFTSQRETGAGMYTIYKVNYTDTEMLPIAINGKFNCIGQPDLKEIKLTIHKNGVEDVIADISTDKVTGTYSVELPGPGIYQFTVNAEGFQPQTEEISFLEYSDNILVQDIFLSRNEQNKEDLAISTRRITDANALDGSLTANVDENGNITLGISAKDLANQSNDLTAAVGADGGMGNIAGSGNVGNSNQGIVFKVQVGAFHKLGKDVVKKRLEKKADSAMLSNTDDNSWLRFYMGTETNYLSAKNLKYILVQAGFNDAFIVAFQGGKSIPVQEAINKTANR